jgi:hypothetical protein
MVRRTTLKPDRRKVTLIVLYIPSVERDGHTPVEQDVWVRKALDFFGSVFGGATAFPKARGIWRDSERNDALIYDEPVMLHRYVDPKQLASDEVQKALGDFCRHLGRETKQGEVGLIVDNEYFAFTKF